MDREVFRNKLIKSCEQYGLDVALDGHLVYLSLNLCYDVFRFPSTEKYFEYKSDKELYPIKPLEKCYDWNEDTLSKCLEIARYWNSRSKQRKMSVKLGKIQEDF